MGWNKEEYVPSIHMVKDKTKRRDRDQIGQDPQTNLLCIKNPKELTSYEERFGPRLYWSAYYWDDVTCKKCLKKREKS